ncbi:hypothetical protein IAT38_006773 [Cryptococcus sp. DSM 104549]
MFHDHQHIANLTMEGYPSFRQFQASSVTRYQIDSIPWDQTDPTTPRYEILPIPAEPVRPNSWAPEQAAQYQRALGGYYNTIHLPSLYTRREHSVAEGKINQSVNADLLNFYTSEDYSPEEKCLIASAGKPSVILSQLIKFPLEEQRKNWIAGQIESLRRQMPNRAEVFEAKERMMGLVTEPAEAEPAPAPEAQSIATHCIGNARDDREDDTDSESEGDEEDAEGEEDWDETKSDDHVPPSGAPVCCSSLTEISDDDQAGDGDQQSDADESEDENVSDIVEGEESEDEYQEDDDDEEYQPASERRKTSAARSYLVTPQVANLSQSAKMSTESSSSPAASETRKSSAKRKRDPPAQDDTSGNGEQPRKKRDKCAVSCERCKALKKKCEGGFPCDYCMTAAKKMALQNGGKLSVESWDNRKQGGKKDKPPPWCVILPEYGIPDHYNIDLAKPYFVLVPEAMPALNAAMDRRGKLGISLRQEVPEEKTSRKEKRDESQVLPAAGGTKGDGQMERKKGYSKSGKKLGRPVKNKTAS